MTTQQFDMLESKARIALQEAFPGARLLSLYPTLVRVGDTTRGFIAWSDVNPRERFTSHRFCIDSSGHTYIAYGNYGFATATAAKADALARCKEF